MIKISKNLKIHFNHPSISVRSHKSRDWEAILKISNYFEVHSLSWVVYWVMIPHLVADSSWYNNLNGLLKVTLTRKSLFGQAQTIVNRPWSKVDRDSELSGQERPNSQLEWKLLTDLSESEDCRRTKRCQWHHVTKITVTENVCQCLCI